MTRNTTTADPAKSAEPAVTNLTREAMAIHMGIALETLDFIVERGDLVMNEDGSFTIA